MDERILLVAKDQVRANNYLSIMDKYDVNVNLVGSLKDAINLASNEQHNGILIDLPLMVRASQVIKGCIDDLFNGLPGGALNIHSPSGEVRLLQRGDKSCNCSSIDQFVEICSKFDPKIIFSKNRVQLNYNALLAMTPDLNNPDRTACINISTGGCFLFCVREDIVKDSTVWIRLVGLNGDNPIEAVVKWIREWGATHNIPGIGVEFKNISHDLKKQINDIAKTK